MDKKFNKPVQATAHDVVASIAELLIHKGIITNLELVNKINEKMEEWK
jgi:hypothetical protein